MMVRDGVRRFIVDELNFEDRDVLTDDYPLIENQVIDSLGIFQIVTWLESEFGIAISDEELVPTNFGTIGGIARLVESKRGG
jgi:acyl carrier protein